MTEKEKDQTFLDARKTAEVLANMYQEDKKQKTFNLLLCGKHGSGKTFLLRTARKPVYIDSFDKGGTRCLRDLITSGDVISNTSYEKEIPMEPFAFEQWKRDMEDKVLSGFFNHIGTYVLDSLTSWQQAILNSLLDKVGFTGTTPIGKRDYLPQRTLIENMVHEILTIPCDVIITAHLTPVNDAETGNTEWVIMTTGMAKYNLPTLFDEIWIMDPEETSGGVEYRILTQNTGSKIARSRLNIDGKIEQYEKPNIKAILKKASEDYSDLPRLLGD